MEWHPGQERDMTNYLSFIKFISGPAAYYDYHALDQQQKSQTIVMKFILILCTVFSMPGFLRAQAPCECQQAEQLRAQMGRYFNSGQLDSAEYITGKLKDFREKGCLIFYNGWMAQLSIARKRFDEAREFLHSEKELLQQNNCPKGLYVRHYSTQAKLYEELNQSDSFVMAGLEGISAAEEAHDYYGLSRANTDVATAFSEMGQREKAIAYYQQGMKAARLQNKVPTLVASVETRLGTEYLQLFTSTGNQRFADSALLLGKEAIDSARPHHDMLAYLEANQLLADHALQTHQYEKVIGYADEIIQTTPRGVHLFDRLTYAGFSKKSEALFALQRFPEAEQYADSALAYAQAFNALMMVQAYEDIYNAAKATNHTAKSLAAYEKMITIRDSLYSVEKNKSITELEKKYVQVKNENTIKDLAKKKQLYLLLAVTGLLAVIAIAFFLRQQSLKHKKNILETQRRLNQARMNPQFFYNTLTALQQVALKEQDGQLMASHLSRFSHIMRDTLESTYKEYVTIEEETIFLAEYLEVQRIRFPSSFSYAITVSKDIEPDELLIPSMIIQPFVENSIEYGFSNIDRAGRIDILFSMTSKEVLIEISDNGNRLMTSSQEMTNQFSRASQIIKDRIYLLNIKLKSNAGFSIDNNTTTPGVTVRIHLPIINKPIN